MSAPSHALILRRATILDAAPIAELFTTTRRTCMPYLPALHSAMDDRQFIERRVLAETEVWIAEVDGGALAGFMSLQGDHLHHLYVAPAHQSRGVGSALLTKAMELRPTGFTLWVFQQNKRARRFYESHGLTVVKLTQGEGNEERLPDAQYAWAGSSRMASAADVLRRGGLVGFPTETVYGLGADAGSETAVWKIFAAKGRPATNPLIVHVADVETAKRYTTNWSGAAEKLAAAYWPGPLTLVLPKTADIPDVVTAGRGTVGLRAPRHPLALELLRAFGGPLAAPSANRSNRVSPTTAAHVREELGESVDLILDGGPCAVGIESTVLDLSDDVPRILRPGGLSRAHLEAVIGPVETAHRAQSEAVAAASPGQFAIHYAPRAPAYRVPYGHLRDGVETLGRQGTTVGAIMTQSSDRRLGWGGLPLHVLPDDPAGYARGLYAALRALDAFLPQLAGSNKAAILVEMPPDTPEWAAVRDRLLRATVSLDP